MLPEEQSALEPNTETMSAEPVLQSTVDGFADLPETVPQRRTRRWVMLGGIVVLGLLAAAFVGGRWMNRSGSQAGWGGGRSGGAMIVSDAGMGGEGMQVEIVPPKEFPQ